MTKYCLKWLMLLLVSVALGGCISGGLAKPETLPDRLGGTGMVMLQFAPRSWYKAEVTLQEHGKSNVHRGFWVRELKPGRYTLATAKIISGYDLAYRGMTTHFKTLTLNIEFEIQPGKVTNLGMVYMRTTEKGKRAQVIRLQNGDSARRYLQDFYPALTDNLSADSFITAPASYANHQLDLLRRVLTADAYHPADTSDSEYTDLTRIGMPVTLHGRYGVGDLGILFDLGPGKSGKPELIPLPTLDVLSVLDFSDSRGWFVTERGRVFKREGSGVKEIANLPDDFFALRGALFSDRGVVLADRFFNLLISTDDGHSWQYHKQTAAPGQEFTLGGFDLSPNGLYATAAQVAYIGGQSLAVSIDAATGQVQPFALPDDVGNDLKHIYQTDQGIYVQAEDSGQPSGLYFRTAGGGDWISHEIMTYMFCNLGFPGNTGAVVTANCGVPDNMQRYVSRDRGASWQPL